MTRRTFIYICIHLNTHIYIHTDKQTDRVFDGQIFGHAFSQLLSPRILEHDHFIGIRLLFVFIGLKPSLHVPVLVVHFLLRRREFLTHFGKSI